MKFDLESDIVLEGCFNLVRRNLAQSLFEEVYAELEIEVFFLQVIDVLNPHSVMKGITLSEEKIPFLGPEESRSRPSHSALRPCLQHV